MIQHRSGASVRFLAGCITLLLVLGTLAACGKKGPPMPAGPPDQVTWPRMYPTR